MSRSTVQGFGVSVSAVALATVLTTALWRWLQPSASLMFFPAIMSAALSGGLWPGLLATALSALSVAFFFIPPFYSFNLGPDDFIRMTVFVGVALVTTSLSAARQQAREAQRQAIGDLEIALARVQRLSSLLPMCPVCKSVRNDQGYWTEVHGFLKNEAGIELRHALCPTCALTHYKEFHVPGPTQR